MTRNHQPIDNISVISVTLQYIILLVIRISEHHFHPSPTTQVFYKLITFYQYASKPSCTQGHICILKNYHNICSRILYFPSHMYRHREKNDERIYSHVDKHTFWEVGYELYI